jgi:dienelactone hydrolase
MKYAKLIPLLFSVVVSTNSCEALSNIQQSQKTNTTNTSTVNNNTRIQEIIYPTNADRIPTTAQLPTEEKLDYSLVTYGERYKDNIFSDYSISTEYYAKNITDFEGKSKNLIVDIISPKNDIEKNRPCILYIFGGGFSMKIDDGMQEICKSMALKGYVVAAIDYRIGFPNANLAIPCTGDVYEGFLTAELRAAQDGIAAIKYIKANATRLGINPNLIFVGGQSAGAITALNAAFYDNNETDTRISKIGGNLDASTAISNKNIDKKVAGIFSFSGAISNATIINNPNNTPTLLINGTCDEFIYPDKGEIYKCDVKSKNALLNFPNIYGPEYIYNALRTKNNPTFYIKVCQGGHSMNNWGYQKVVDWLSSFTYAVMQNKFRSGKAIVHPDKTICNIENCD